MTEPETAEAKTTVAVVSDPTRAIVREGDNGAHRGRVTPISLPTEDAPDAPAAEAVEQAAPQEATAGAALAIVFTTFQVGFVVGAALVYILTNI